MTPEEIRQDYFDWLQEEGLSEFDVAFLMHENFIIDCTCNKEGLRIAPSVVASLGVFAQRDFEMGSSWVAGEGNVKYACGRFINHCQIPNCEFIEDGDQVICRLLRPVKQFEELFVDYRANSDLPSVRSGLKSYKKALSFKEEGVISTKVMSPVLPTQDQIDAMNLLEIEMLKEPQVHCPLEHHFTPGLYARQMFVPKGTLITGLLHKTKHIFVISQGDISIWYPGGEATRVQAPYTGITEAGTRRMGFAHEDTIWTTFHATELTDPDEIIEEITDTRPNPLMTDKDFARMGWRKEWAGEPTLNDKKMEALV